MIKITQYQIEDGVNEPITICIDYDAEPKDGLSFVLDQQGASNYLYVNLEGLKGLLEAAQKLSE